MIFEYYKPTGAARKTRCHSKLRVSFSRSLAKCLGDHSALLLNTPVHAIFVTVHSNHLKKHLVWPDIHSHVSHNVTCASWSMSSQNHWPHACPHRIAPWPTVGANWRSRIEVYAFTRILNLHFILSASANRNKRLILHSMLSAGNYQVSRMPSPSFLHCIADLSAVHIKSCVSVILTRQPFKWAELVQCHSSFNNLKQRLPCQASKCCLLAIKIVGYFHHTLICLNSIQPTACSPHPKLNSHAIQRWEICGPVLVFTLGWHNARRASKTKAAHFPIWGPHSSHFLPFPCWKNFLKKA